MSFAPIFDTLKANSGVTALLGSNPCRVFPHGRAPAKGATGYSEPYAVYRQIGGSPENHLSTVPNADFSITQIDVYANTTDAARDAITAIRDAVQVDADVSSVRDDGVDEKTSLRRMSIDVEWITNRI